MKKLPLHFIETNEILRKLISTHRALSELKGIIKLIPNEEIILNTLSLQESKDSSEIEQIVSTLDEIFKSDNDRTISSQAKEVKSYALALNSAVKRMKNENGISNNLLVEVAQLVKGNSAGFRKTSGTKLVNQFGQVVYTPPQDEKEIIELMHNLEKYINDNSLENIDPLTKMAIIHHQFESIHPFYDGNGRVGRILNIIYLILNNLLDLPVLYLSGYIIKTKGEYYKLLQETRDSDSWERWVLYILDAVEKISINTIQTVKSIKSLMLKQKHLIRDQSKIYSQELLNTIFSHPYTKIEFIVTNLKVTRITATRYLNILKDLGILEIRKVGRTNYYINKELFTLLKKIDY